MIMLQPKPFECNQIFFPETQSYFLLYLELIYKNIKCWIKNKNGTPEF